MIAFLRDLPFISNYWGFFLSILTLATGTAFFKPSIQGSLAHNLTKANSSIGWGIFYWVVNVGAFIGHYLPSLLLGLSVLLPGFLHGEAQSKASTEKAQRDYPAMREITGWSYWARPRP